MPSLHVDPSDLNPGQLEFVRCNDESALLSGGFGAGKTIAGVLRLLRQVSENPGVPGLVLAPNWRTLWSVTYRSIRNIFKAAGAESILPVPIDKQNECYLDFWGTPVFLRSAKNVDSFDGLDVGWLLGDEIRHWSKQAYDVAIGRVRVDCPRPFRGFTSTPQMHWMAEEFNADKPGRTLIRAPTRENARNLNPGYIEGLRQSYSPRMQRAVLEGLFTILEGAVYEAFDPDPKSQWMIDYRPGDFEGRKTIMGVDPGYRMPAIFWAHEVSPTEWVVFDELILENTSAQAMAEMVNAKSRSSRAHAPHEIWVDPAANSKSQSDASDVTSALKMIRCRSGGMRNIYWLAPPYNSIEYGVDKTRVLLGDPSQGMQPRVKFARHLHEIEKGKKRGIIKDLGSYRYPEVKDGRPVSDVPLKDGLSDHFCDAFRYFCVGRWLRSPLRTVDPTIDRAQATGYKAA